MGKYSAKKSIVQTYSERDALAKRDIARHGQMVELETVRNIAEPLQKVVHLVEATAELDQGHRGKRTLRVHLADAFLDRVQIAHDEQQVTGGLDRQEAAAGHVYAQSAVEVLDGRSRRGLQLDHVHALVGRLVVDDYLHVQSALLDDALDRLQVNPQVVGIKDLELAHAFELVHVVLGHLGDLEKSQFALVVYQGTSLDTN